MVDFQSRDTSRGFGDDDDEEDDDPATGSEPAAGDEEDDDPEPESGSGPDETEVDDGTPAGRTADAARDQHPEPSESGDGPLASGPSDEPASGPASEDDSLASDASNQPDAGGAHAHDHGHGSAHGSGHSHEEPDHGHAESGHDHGHAAGGHDHGHTHGETPETLGVAVVTVSSTRTREDDPSGDEIQAAIAESGHEVVSRDVLRDDLDGVQTALLALTDRSDVDVVVTTGGTGVTTDDVTIEAASPLFDKELPGFGELFRILSYEDVGTKAMVSRATAGVVDGAAVFCLPGSTDAVRLGMAELVTEEMGHVVGLARRGE